MLSLYVFAMSISPPGTMGGDTKILLEFSRRWAAQGVDIHIITSESGYVTCKNYGLKDVTYHVASPYVIEKLGRPLCQVTQTVYASLRALKSFPANGKVYIYSATNFWPDVLPALLLKRRLPGSQWIGSCYLPIPSPFKGFENAYGKTSKLLPDFKTLANYFVEKPSTRLMNQSADWMFVTNDLDKKYFTDQGFPEDRLRAIYGGVSLHEIEQVPQQEIVYDGCFVGRIHPMKGVDYLVKIWENVCRAKPNARLALIGNGSRDFEDKIRQEIKSRNLSANIDLLGYVDGVEKYKILKSSRVFLHTSIYDNSGMTAAEAMACGLPAVRFDIPALRVAYPKGMLVVPLKNSEAFAAAVLRLLTDKELYHKTQGEAFELAKSWDWDFKATRILASIT